MVEKRFIPLVNYPPAIEKHASLMEDTYGLAPFLLQLWYPYNVLGMLS
jgi:hypothetical protein